VCALLKDSFLYTFYISFNLFKDFSAFVPSRPEDKAVNYPTRPVDSSTDFEGTASMQPSQTVCK